MDSLPLHRRMVYRYLGRAYSITHSLATRTILGLRLVNLVRWPPVLLFLYGWLTGWPIGVQAGLILLIGWTNYSFWQAKRDNYTRFIVNKDFTIVTVDETRLLPPNKRIAARATGLFSVSGRESNLLLRPAAYWYVPLGEHVVMAEEKPGKFLYQFFSAQSLQNIQNGWLLFGSEPIDTLAITFLARWGPDYTRFGQVFEDGSDADLPPPRRVTIYICPLDKETGEAIRHTIVADARRARQNIG